MSAVSDRIKQLREFLRLTREEMEQITGISRNSWNQVERGNQRANEDHFSAIAEHWPQFAYWLTTGNTIPEAGQISPELEKVRKDSSRAGKAG